MGEVKGAVRLRTDGRTYDVYRIPNNLSGFELFGGGDGRNYFFSRMSYGNFKVYVGREGEEILREVKFTEAPLIFGSDVRLFFKHGGDGCELSVPSRFEFKKNRYYQGKRPMLWRNGVKVELTDRVFGFTYEDVSSSPVKFRRKVAGGV